MSLYLKKKDFIINNWIYSERAENFLKSFQPLIIHFKSFQSVLKIDNLIWVENNDDTVGAIHESPVLLKSKILKSEQIVLAYFKFYKKEMAET